MGWQDQLNGDSLSWLLETDSPGVRFLALRDLLDLPAKNARLRAARKLAYTQGPIATVLGGMEAQGFWMKSGPGYNPKYRSTVWAITLLAQLGASSAEDARIALACNYVLEHALASTGQFTMTGAPSGTVDCLQGNLCWALQQLGCHDERLDVAYEWMARTVTGEGIAPATDRDAPVRYHSTKSGPMFSCGANYKQSCAWGGVKVLTALGYGRDPRLKNAWDIILNKQDAQGRWALDYDYIGKTWGDYGRGKQANKWVTLRALRVLKAAFS
jgi:hypothetical protein